MFNLIGNQRGFVPSNRPSPQQPIDTSTMTPAALDALPGEIARRNRVGRLAAAMKALHAQRMAQLDAGVLDEVAPDGSPSAATSASAALDPAAKAQAEKAFDQQLVAAAPLKFHTTGWDDDHPSHQRKRRRHVSPDSGMHRVEPRPDGVPPLDEADSSFLSAGRHSAGSGASIARSGKQHQQQQQQHSSFGRSTRFGDKSPSSIARQRALQQKSAARQRQQEQQAQQDEQHDEEEKKRQEEAAAEEQRKQQQEQAFEGDTEAHRLRNAAVELRNINLQLKTQFERRYRARLDDNFDSDGDPGDRPLSVAEAEAVNADIADHTTMAGAARVGVKLEQTERELGDATRQWRQAALDAELLTGELLRAQATIERYRMHMDAMAEENASLRTEVEQLRRQVVAGAAGARSSSSMRRARSDKWGSMRSLRGSAAKRGGEEALGETPPSASGCESPGGDPYSIEGSPLEPPLLSSDAKGGAGGGKQLSFQLTDPNAPEAKADDQNEATARPADSRDEQPQQQDGNNNNNNNNNNNMVDIDGCVRVQSLKIEGSIASEASDLLNGE